MRAKLVVVGGDTKTPEVELHLPAVLGRGREATLTLPHPLVSRQHCEIYESDGQLMVRDLGSLNGTFVANERVNEGALDNGQLLTVGTVTFRAIYLADDGSAIHSEQQPSFLPVSNEETIPASEIADANPTEPAPEVADANSAEPAPKVADANLTEPASQQDGMPPMATPVPEESNANAAADDDDDLSSFFDSLQ